MANGNFAGGDGTVNNPYLIEDADDLNAVRNGLDKHYKLIKDIDLNVSPYNEGEGWIPIGDDKYPFKGSFDGDNHIINNLYINCPEKRSNNGLFGKTESSDSSRLVTIENIGMEAVKIINAFHKSGCLIGYLGLGSTIKNCYILSGSIKLAPYAGSIGGLVGEVSSGKIHNVYAHVSISGSLYAYGGGSGLVGTLRWGEIRNSYSIGNIDVINSSRVGGLVSSHVNGDIVNCYSNVSINKNGEFIGGLIGSASETAPQPTNSFWNVETSNQSTSAGGTGLTTQQMKTAQTFIDVGWDKETLEDGTPIWKLRDGEYPKLWFEKEPYKVLLKQNNQYYTIKSEHYQNGQFQPLTLEGGEQPNENDYESFGFDNVNDLLTSQNTKVIQGTDKGELGEGKYFEVELDNEIKKINNIELK